MLTFSHELSVAYVKIVRQFLDRAYYSILNRKYNKDMSYVFSVTSWLVF